LSDAPLRGLSDLRKLHADPVGRPSAAQPRIPLPVLVPGGLRLPGLGVQWFDASL